ncbi:MAG TPA: hypothetical protein VIJ76_00850 [Galbitalea sp.]
MSDTLIGVILGGALALVGQFLNNLMLRSDRWWDRLSSRSESLVDELMACNDEWSNDSQSAVVNLGAVSKGDRWESARAAQSSAKAMRLILRRLRFSIQNAKVQAALEAAIVKIQFASILVRVAAAMPDTEGTMDQARTSLTASTAAIDHALDVIAAHVGRPSSVFARRRSANESDAMR